MKRVLVILIFIVLTLFDGFAVSIAVPLPILAVLVHLVVSGLVYGTVKSFTDPQRRGRFSLALFCGFLCLITPVLGCMLSALMLHNLVGPIARRDQPVDFVVGNPLTARKRSARRADPAVGEPLIYAFVHASSTSAHHLAIPLLRHPLDRKAVTLLQKLRGLGDSRTRLFACAALTSSVENREATLDHLRRRAESSPDSVDAHLNLAEMLFSTAESGVFGDLQNNRLNQEAGQHFAAAAKLDSTQVSALFGKGMTAIRNGELDDVPEWYGRLLAAPEKSDPDNLASRLEAELFAASGNWKRTQRAAAGIPNLPESGKRFWNTKPEMAS